MGKRLLKQFLYGTFYLLLFGGIFLGLYAIFLKPAPSCFDNRQNGRETGADCGGDCVSCEIKNLQPLVLSAADLYSAGRDFSASVELQNPNSSYAVKSFDYEVNFYDSAGKVLENIKNKAFIYAGESKSIIEAGGRITNGIPVRAEIAIDQKSAVWEKETEFFRPPFKFGDDTAATSDGEQIVVSGNITNLNNYNLSRVIVNAFLINKLGARIGASKTEIQNLNPFRVENFKIFIPVDKAQLNSVDLAATNKSVFAEILK